MVFENTKKVSGYLGDPLKISDSDKLGIRGKFTKLKKAVKSVSKSRELFSVSQFVTICHSQMFYEMFENVFFTIGNDLLVCKPRNEFANVQELILASI